MPLENSGIPNQPFEANLEFEEFNETEDIEDLLLKDDYYDYNYEELIDDFLDEEN